VLSCHHTVWFSIIWLSHSDMTQKRHDTNTQMIISWHSFWKQQIIPDCHTAGRRRWLTAVDLLSAGLADWWLVTQLVAAIRHVVYITCYSWPVVITSVSCTVSKILSLFSQHLKTCSAESSTMSNYSQQKFRLRAVGAKLLRIDTALKKEKAAK